MEGEKNKECNVCHIKDEKNKLCSRCRLVRYCSAECQKKDWATHKLECKAPQNQLVPFNKDEQVKQKGETKNKAILSFKHLFGSVKDEEKAKQLCLESVKEGNKLAEALKYMNGWDLQKNLTKAREMLEEMVSKDKKGENEETSYCYILLAIIQRDKIEKYVGYMNKSIEMSNGFACYCLGNEYLQGTILRKDVKKYVELYKKGAELGDSNSMLSMFDCHRLEDRVKRDEKKELEYLQKAAQLDHPLAFYNLAGMYLVGELGLKKDEKKALELYYKAAELNFTGALYKLGLSYQEGDLGLKVDQQKAFTYYKRAADLGSENAMFNVGAAYRFGLGVEQDDKKALEWFQKAASLGVPPASYMIGTMYERGEGVKKDLKKAYKCFQKSANLGFDSAIKYLKEFKNKYNI